MNICLIGPPGAGKSTHAKQLIKSYQFLQLDTGELIRSNIQDQTAIGFLASYHVKNGALVPDEVVNAIVSEWLCRVPSSSDVLVDGYPRTLEQAQFIDQQFDSVGRELNVMVYLSLSDKVVMERLLGRLSCSSCGERYHVDFCPPKQLMICDQCGSALTARNDDIEEMIRVKLRTFRRSIEPVLDYYRESCRLVTLDGSNSVGDITKAIASTVEQISSGSGAFSFDQYPQSPDALTGISDTQLVSDQSDFNLVLIGGPGSGKGTQAEELQSHLQVPHVSTGSLFRENLANETSLGILAKSYMEKGELVPDDVTEAMVEDRLLADDMEPGFILDGFPRTLSQALALSAIIQARNRSISCALYIRVPDAELVRRITGRLLCKDCQAPYHIDFNPPAVDGICDKCNGMLYQRDDDNETTVQARLQTFHAQTAPIINYYHTAGVLVEIDGEGSIEDITQRSIDVVSSLTNKLGLQD